jgi:hypothetical protein
MGETNPQPIEIHTGIGVFRAMIMSPDGQLVGEVRNEEELYDVLVQIKERNLSGYYGYRIDADSEKGVQKFTITSCGILQNFGDTFIHECLVKLST